MKFSNRQPRVRWMVLLVVAIGCLGASRVVAGDWPQILGPQRNGVAQQESLPDGWNKPPKSIWTFDVGSGFSGVAVADGKVVVFHRV